VQQNQGRGVLFSAGDDESLAVAGGQAQRFVRPRPALEDSVVKRHNLAFALFGFIDRFNRHVFLLGSVFTGSQVFPK